MSEDELRELNRLLYPNGRQAEWERLTALIDDLGSGPIDQTSQPQWWRNPFYLTVAPK